MSIIATIIARMTAAQAARKVTETVVTETQTQYRVGQVTNWGVVNGYTTELAAGLSFAPFKFYLSPNMYKTLRQAAQVAKDNSLDSKLWAVIDPQGDIVCVYTSRYIYKGGAGLDPAYSNGYDQ
jgi:hypothetical protein